MIVNGNALHIPLRDKSVHMAVTSPPYWGLRDYGTAQWIGGDPLCQHITGNQVQDSKAPGAITSGVRSGSDNSHCKLCGAVRVDDQLGLERVPDCLGWATGAPCGHCYVCHMVQVFREVRRVLRDDGLLFLNLGDSFANERSWGGKSGAKNRDSDRGGYPRHKVGAGLGNKQMVGIPWRVALALQADGWILRMDVVWAKPNVMPESVEDRPTKAHEYIFILAKSARYFWDQEAVREKLITRLHSPGNKPAFGVVKRNDFGTDRMNAIWGSPAGRNLRSVWTITTQPTSEAHFAVFPEAIPERCIKAGSSAGGVCPKCGKPYERIVKKPDMAERPTRKAAKQDGQRIHQNWDGFPQASGQAYQNWRDEHPNETIGWQPACKCNAGDPVPAIVLDPFFGSGTTGKVAARLGRKYVGVELSWKYIEDICANRIQTDVALFPDLI